MKRFLLLSGLVVLLLMAIAPTASAAIFWCEDDPLVKIITPGGNKVNVHVTNYGEVNGDAKAVRKALKQAVISYTATSGDGGQGTAVTISVLILTQGEPFQTRSVVSTLPRGAGVLLAEAAGTSGQIVTLSFNLDVP